MKIRATLTKHVCDARCVHARGFVCNCSCGGKNHGRGFTAEAVTLEPKTAARIGVIRQYRASPDQLQLAL